MKSNKFLTVFAVFDDETQRKLKNIQDDILSLGEKGTQTMDIPFHISLGSFPLKDEEMLKAKIKEVCSENHEFYVTLNKINHFDNKVLFIEPKKSNELKKLHNIFDMNYADGFPYHAHTTIFCADKEQVIKAKKYLSKIFKPINAKITGIQMGEFFPTKMIIKEKLISTAIKENTQCYSYVMGVDDKIKELKKEGFKIKKYGKDHAVTFSDDKSHIWEDFISNNLDIGYWNEYLYKDSIIFLFHLADGIRRFEVNNFTDSEVLALCEKLCNRKFESIKSMLTENKFYKKIFNN